MKKNVLIIIACFVCLLIHSSMLRAQAPASPFGINSNCTNILKNGNFKYGSSYWQVGAGWGVGNNSAGTTDDVVDAVLSQNIPFLVGDEKGYVQLSFDIVLAMGTAAPSNPITFSVEVNGVVYATVQTMVGTADTRTTVTYSNGASGNKVSNTNANGCDIGSICCTSISNPYSYTNEWKIWIPASAGPAVLGFRIKADGDGGSADDIALHNVRLLSCADFGDNPDSYGTVQPNAPIHGITNVLKLGQEVDANVDGLPAAAGALPSGDDTEAFNNYAFVSGHATQSTDSTLNKSASFANDSVFGQSYSKTLPGLYEWWMVDLGRPMEIGDIRIFNQVNCCSENLSNARVMLFDNVFNPANTLAGLTNAQASAVFNVQLGDMSNTTFTTINANNRIARYLLVQRTGNTNAPLALREVMVMARPSDDEDGVQFFTPLNINGQVYTNYTVNLGVTNTTGTVANLCGWIDWNNNNIFEAAEGVCTTVPNGATSASLTWPTTTLTASPVNKGSYARFRVTTDGLTVNNWTGIASNGEVEDYLIRAVDFAPLPVQLLNFSANKKGDDVLLTWQAASEKNSKGFYVQYSIDGRSWQTLTFIAGTNNNNTGKSYSYLHHDNKTEMNRFYRLLQEDVNGSVTISDVREVNFTTTGNIQLNPNPVKDVLNIQTAGSFAATQLSLYNSTGELLMQKKYTGNNNQVNLSHFAAGVYILRLSDDKGESIFRKIMKQ